MGWFLTQVLAVGCISLVTALTPCHLRSYNCLTSSQQQQDQQQHSIYACPARGHFPHPRSHFRYYKCTGAGYAACDCACRYRDMCFDPATNQCQFAFLPQVHNCTGSRNDVRPRTAPVLSTAPQSTAATTAARAATRRKAVMTRPLQDSRTYDMKYRFKDQHGAEAPPRAAAGGDAYAVAVSKKVVPRERQRPPRVRDYNLVRQDILTAQEVMLREKGINPLLVDDISLFPAWAVAVVVLCVVMLLVLMVIFLY